MPPWAGTGIDGAILNTLTSGYANEVEDVVCTKDGPGWRAYVVVVVVVVRSGCPALGKKSRWGKGGAVIT